MESGVIYQEVTLAPEVDVLLPRKESDVYLLSGKNWRNVECAAMTELKEIYYGFDLILWDLTRVFDKINAESLAYSFPGIEIPQEIGIDDFAAKILPAIGIDIAGNEVLLIRYSYEKRAFCYCKFAADDADSFKWHVCKYAQKIHDKIYGIGDQPVIADFNEDFCTHPSFGADSKFTSEQNYLIDRAIDAVERLQLTGLPMELIKKLISVETRFSRIVITDKFRIFLADYNNKEVVMGPLPKVVLLFFLKHDREFMFSDLMDYKEELLEIYEKVSNRGDKEKMRQSIESLVDPTNNSICEKCTAVRKAFLEQITYNVARHYFIDGRQGLPKKIHLNRSLVVWDAKI